MSATEQKLKPIDNRPRSYSMCMNIEGFIRNNRYPRDYNIFEQGDGTPMSPEEARTYLQAEQAKGHKVIPCSAECGNPCKHANSGCTGFDYQGSGCPGRIVDPNRSNP